MLQTTFTPNSWLYTDSQNIFVLATTAANTSRKGAGHKVGATPNVFRLGNKREFSFHF